MANTNRPLTARQLEDLAQEKSCGGCCQILPYSAFDRDPYYDRPNGWCRTCKPAHTR